MNSVNGTVEEIVRFCTEGILKIMKQEGRNENNVLRHEYPCVPVIDALMSKYNTDIKTAHWLIRPSYWVLMEEGVLKYESKGGAHWELAKNVDMVNGNAGHEELTNNNINIDELIEKTIKLYGDSMQERVRGL